MGVVPSVGFDRFPKQGTWLGRRVQVCFDYDTSRTIGGTIIREDDEPPGLMLINLDDGRTVRSVECQYSLLRIEAEPSALIPGTRNTPIAEVPRASGIPASNQSARPMRRPAPPPGRRGPLPTRG